MLSPVDTCGNGCGLIAALIGCLGFGSFGAPLKSDAINKVNADPFVLQTYKSTMCFLTCWLILPLGIEFEFTPYGIVSGVLWVSGGICGIYGIRNAGLAISVGTWSSITVLVSFAWGIFVFDEQVESITKTIIGIFMMIVGFIGMAYFSSSVGSGGDGDGGGGSTTEALDKSNIVGMITGDILEEEGQGGGEDVEGGSGGNNAYATESESDGTLSSSLHLNDNDNDNDLTEGLLENDHLHDEEVATRTRRIDSNSNNPSQEGSQENGLTQTDECQETISEGCSPTPATPTEGNNELANNGNTVQFFGMQCDRKVLGLMGAAMDGILGGSNLIPMKIAPSIDRGADYIISFAIGAAIATVAGWILRFLVASHRKQSFEAGLKSLPSMHLTKILLPGALSGTLWSIGNIGQIMSVTFLGETIGMSIVQSQMIISGILGIVWFDEIQGRKKIIGWVLSAVVTFIGIICLSGEHKS